VQAEQEVLGLARVPQQEAREQGREALRAQQQARELEQVPVWVQEMGRQHQAILRLG
jgi:hypothetical protein